MTAGVGKGVWLEICTSVNSRRNDILPDIFQELWDFTLNYQEVGSEQIERYTPFVICR